MLKQSQCECGGSQPKKYRYTLTVQSPGGTADAGGHVDLTDDANWTTEGTIKANFLSRGGRESRVFDQVQAEVSHIIESPWNNFSASVHPSWRFQLGARVFNIAAAYDVDEMRKEMRYHVAEVV